MAKRETNNRKREEMKVIMATVLGEKGWSQTDLAAVMYVTGSAISQWKLGKSMGTNDQRAKLGDLPRRDSSDARDLMQRVVNGAKANTTAQQVKVTDLSTPGTYEAYLKREDEDREHSIEWHSKRLVECDEKARRATQPSAHPWDMEYVTKKTHGKGDEAMTSYEWDKKYHAESRDEAQARTPEIMATRAKLAQERAVEYAKKELAKMQSYQRKMEKILAKW